MNDEQTTSEASQLDEIIAGYLAADECGRPPDRARLIESHPDLADELRAFFADHDRFNEMLGEDESPPAPPRVRDFGDYELQDEIARGGMGAVYKARQKGLNRTVAVKMILGGGLADEHDLKRFRAEAKAAGKLQHSGIVSVHEVGIHDGLHYFSMDYVEGRSLADVAREAPLSPRRAAGYLRQIAEAVHFAHQEGVLHRDLKPSNVLVDSSDSVKITDFGLARALRSDSSLTQTGQIVGTPQYMSPEQAQAKHGLVGPASDVYAMGVILYELLTGRPPFRSQTALETLRLVARCEPLPPRRLNPAVPQDLETICLKCLEKKPHRRYESAHEFAEDLGRFLRHEPILARRPTAMYRFRKFARRNTSGLIVAVSLVLLLLQGCRSGVPRGDRD